MLRTGRRTENDHGRRARGDGHAPGSAFDGAGGKLSRRSLVSHQRFPHAPPPLRERPGDIPALVEHFGWRAGKRLGRTPLAPSAPELDLLIRYPWPCNIRELAAVIERAAILGGGHRLEIAAALGVTPAIVPRPDAIAPKDPRPAGILTLDEATRLHIERALVASRGRIEGPSGAAAMLDVNPHTLRSRMRRLGLQWRDFRVAVRGE